MRRIMLHFRNFQSSAFNQNRLPQHNTPPLQIQIRSQISPSQLRQQHSGLLHRSRASMHRTRPTHVFRQHLDDLQTSLYYFKKNVNFLPDVLGSAIEHRCQRLSSCISSTLQSIPLRVLRPWKGQFLQIEYLTEMNISFLLWSKKKNSSWML